MLYSIYICYGVKLTFNLEHIGVDILSSLMIFVESRARAYYIQSMNLYL